MKHEQNLNIEIPMNKIDIIMKHLKAMLEDLENSEEILKDIEPTYESELASLSTLCCAIGLSEDKFNDLQRQLKDKYRPH